MGTKALAPGGASTGLRAGLLLLLLGAVAFLLPRDGTSGAQPAADDPDPAPTRAAGAATPGPSLLPTSDLIYRVPARIRESCIRLHEPGQPYETLECTEDLSRVQYRRYAEVADMDRQFDQVTYDLPAISGGCRAGRPSVDIWRYSRTPDKIEGRMGCFLLPGDVPVTVVTQPEQRLLSIVISNPSLGLAGHYDRWATLVPNLPTDRQADAPAQSGAGG
jgi:hypothetical protein